MIYKIKFFERGLRELLQVFNLQQFPSYFIKNGCLICYQIQQPFFVIMVYTVFPRNLAPRIALTSMLYRSTVDASNRIRQRSAGDKGQVRKMLLPK